VARWSSAGDGRQCHPALEALAGANITARRRLGKHSKTLRALARSVALRLVPTDLFFPSKSVVSCGSRDQNGPLFVFCEQ
jgi:hypothetical protein